MSRIGKKPIAIPSGVEVKIENNVVTVKGPKGTESVAYRDEVKVSVVENNIVVEPNSNDRKTGALHGLFRTLIANAVEGVSKGFEKKLEIVGVGYRANMEGSNLNMALGYSHPVLIVPPVGITLSVEANTKITVAGTNKQAVGDVAAFIRSKRPPEVYKEKVLNTKVNTLDAKLVKLVKSKIVVSKLCEHYEYLILNLFQDLMTKVLGFIPSPQPSPTGRGRIVKAHINS